MSPASLKKSTKIMYIGWIEKNVPNIWGLFYTLQQVYWLEISVNMCIGFLIDLEIFMSLEVQVCIWQSFYKFKTNCKNGQKEGTWGLLLEVLNQTCSFNIEQPAYSLLPGKLDVRSSPRRCSPPFCFNFIFSLASVNVFFFPA